MLFGQREKISKDKRKNSVHLIVFRVLCKGYKKDIFTVLLTGFEPNGLDSITVW